MKSYVTVREAAEMLGVSDKRVHQLLANKQLPGIKRGSVWWIQRADVVRFSKLPEGTPGHPRTLRKRH